MTVFVTIGTQEPFDRLIKVMDEIARLSPGVTVIAQVFNTQYEVKHMKAFKFIEPHDFHKYFNLAQLIVSHAGMGTILSALASKKAILIMPRLADLGEHRSNHQMATAKALDRLKYVHVAYNEMELKEKFAEFLQGDLKPLYSIGDVASDELLESLRKALGAAN